MPRYPAPEIVVSCAHRWWRSATLNSLLILSSVLLGGCSSDDSRNPNEDDLLSQLSEHELFELEGPPDLGELPAIVQAEKLSRTDVIPHLEGPIIPGRNYAYCATMKLAWDFFGQSSQVQDPEMAKALDRLGFSKSDLDPNSYLCLFADPKTIESTINLQYPQAALQLPADVETLGTISFAYLQKQLPFREKFKRLNEPLQFHSGSDSVSISISSFGIKSFAEVGPKDTVHRAQLTIIDYKNEDDFVIRLNTMSKQDAMILAKVAPDDTLQETIDSVQERVKDAYSANSEKARIQDGESMIVPIISLGVLREYLELAPAGTAAEGDIPIALQAIQFRLDESGAKLKSYAFYNSIGGDKSPRRFVLDKPFLLYLVQHGSEHPYFALWVENEEVLELMKE